MPSFSQMDLSPRNILCLDVQCTDLPRPELLSLGLSSNSSGRQHYAELDFDEPVGAQILDNCQSFVCHDEVLTQWGLIPGCTGTPARMAQRTAAWLTLEAALIKARSGQPATLAFKDEPSFWLLRKLLQDHGHWTGLERMVTPVNVREMTSRFEANMAADFAFEKLRHRGLARHHALAEALALRAALHTFHTGKRLAL